MNVVGARTAVGRALEFVAVVCRNAAILLLALMSVLIVMQVVGRNAFDLGMPWADELARFCGVGLVFLAAPLLALRGQHVAVDMIPRMLPPRARCTLAGANEVAVLLFCSLTLYGFHSFLSRAGNFSTPAVGIPNWLFYAPALAGFVLLALVTIARLIDLATVSGTDEGRQS